MFHTYFTYVSHEFTCLGCRCLLPSRLFCSAANLRLGADALASLGLVVDCKRRRLLDSQRRRCQPGWPWMAMEIDADWRIKFGTPEDLAKSVEHSDRWVCYSLFMSGLSCFFFQFVFGGCWSCPACQLALVLVEATACMCPDKCEAATWINHCPPFMLAFGVYVDSILIDVWCVCGCMAACYVAPMEWGQNELWKADGWVSEGGMLCNMQKPYKPSKTKPHGDWW